jgi:CIC family chloride channel protein
MTDTERTPRESAETGRATLGFDERFRPPPPSLRLYAAMVLVACAAAGFAIALRTLLDLASALALGDPSLVEGLRRAPAWMRFVGPTIGAALGALVVRWARRLPPSGGVSAVMEAVVLGRGALSLRTSLAKAAASFLAILGGGSLGREGPLIQVGAALGSALAARLAWPTSHRRLLVAVGTAAGFASAYNTPLAATLFVTEIVTGLVTLELIVPVLVASAIGAAISRLALGDGPLYGARAFTLVSPAHVALAIGLGPIGGLLGAGFVALLTRAEHAFGSVRSTIARASIGGAIVGAIAVFLPDVVGNGAEPLRAMLDGATALWLLAVLLVAKPLATTASVGSGSTGGVFTPTMFLGAALGALLGSAVGAEAPVIGALSLVGMAAVVSATTHAPLMASVLAFELSGDYALVVPLLVASALATLVSRRLGLDSLYVREALRPDEPSR